MWNLFAIVHIRKRKNKYQVTGDRPLFRSYWLYATAWMGFIKSNCKTWKGTFRCVFADTCVVTICMGNNSCMYTCQFPVAFTLISEMCKWKFCNSHRRWRVTQMGTDRRWNVNGKLQSQLILHNLTRNIFMYAFHTHPKGSKGLPDNRCGVTEILQVAFRSASILRHASKFT